MWASSCSSLYREKHTIPILFLQGLHGSLMGSGKPLYQIFIFASS